MLNYFTIFKMPYKGVVDIFTLIKPVCPSMHKDAKKRMSLLISNK